MLILLKWQKRLVAVLRSQERRDALDEMKVWCEAHRNVPLRHVDPCSLDDWMDVYLNTHGRGTSFHTQPSALHREEDEFKSPNNDKRRARFK